VNRQVTHCAIAWNPNTRTGKAGLKLEDNSEMNVPVKGIEDFIALTAILRESPLYLRDDGSLYTGWEPDKA